MAVKPIIICLSKSGYATAKRLRDIVNGSIHGLNNRIDEADVFFENTVNHIQEVFAAKIPIIGVCAAGILIRAVAPLLNDKTKEPPVLSISDDGLVVIPLLGGHRGANRLARKISKQLSSHTAITTASDVVFGMALDEPPLGWRLQNPQDVKSVMSALLGGKFVQIIGENIFDIEHNSTGEVRLFAGEHEVKTDGLILSYHPQKYALGLGAARGCSVDEIWNLVKNCLKKAGISKECIACVGSLDLKADEPALIETARRLDVPYRVFTASELERQTPKLASPSDVVFTEVGCHGVCEAASLALAGRDGKLAVPKQKTKNATCAIATSGSLITEFCGRSRGKLSVVGIGPGQYSWRTPEASQLISEAEELVGYGLYIDLLGPLAQGKIRSDFPLGGEEDRCRYALEQAGKGKNIALICSGDAGIYAMGSLVFELLDRGVNEMGVSDAARRIEIQCTPGVSALQAAASRAGAPLGHDFCAISLSDLLTPRQDIIKRLNAAAQGDFVIALYNPVSKRRQKLLTEARDILLKYRPADTPVMLANSLGRPEEKLRYRKLSELKVDEVDMLTIVLIGSSHSRLVNLGEGKRMYTPRGYARKIDGDLS